MVVPVLPAMSLRPSDCARVAVPYATTSRSIDVMMNALRGSIARSASPPATAGFATESVVPFASVIFEIR